MSLTPLQEEVISQCIDMVKASDTNHLKHLYATAVIDGMELLRDALRELPDEVPA